MCSRYRLSLTYPPVRALLEEYKASRGIKACVGLTDRQRGEFEVWAIIEGRKRNIDVFGNSEYIRNVIESNNRIIKYREKKL